MQLAKIRADGSSWRKVNGCFYKLTLFLTFFFVGQLFGETHPAMAEVIRAAKAIDESWPHKSAKPSNVITKEISALVISLGDIHDRSDHVPAEALRLFEHAAEHGHREAASLLATWSSFGKREVMLKWNRVAAELGDARAMTRIGLAAVEAGTENLNGSRSSAADWFRKAAAAGDLRAAFFLGEYELFGDVRSSQKSLADRENAAKNGDSRAALVLGTCFSKGLGVERDFRRAARFFELAAAQGDAAGFRNLGVMHLKAQGVAADPEKAVELLKRAAEDGDPAAAYHLGLCFESGVGVSMDPDQARKWMTQAAKAGHPMAKIWGRDRGVKLLSD